MQIIVLDYKLSYQVELSPCKPLMFKELCDLVGYRRDLVAREGKCGQIC
jgi:hypothetical protein